ncbi:MAG: class II aldolase/adducin family protein [Pseudomonadota bacterium]
MTEPTDVAEDGPDLRAELIAVARRMNAVGINVNKAGNVSVRCLRGAREGLLITPTGLPYDALEPADLVFVPLSTAATDDDAPAGAVGRRAPSSEWRFHVDILRERPEFRAVVHTHSPAATALACHGHGLPAFHYMVAMAGGKDIRCAGYATFGTQALSDNALAALADRRACLLAHHGVIACGATLGAALALAIEVEHLARIYLQARTLGEPPRLTDDEMARVLEKFGTYGAPARRGSDRQSGRG